MDRHRLLGAPKSMRNVARQDNQARRAPRDAELSSHLFTGFLRRFSGSEASRTTSAAFPGSRGGRGGRGRNLSSIASGTPPVTTARSLHRARMLAIPDDSDNDDATLEQLRTQSRLRGRDLEDTDRSMEYWRLIRRRLVAFRWARVLKNSKTKQEDMAPHRRQFGPENDMAKRFLMAVRQNDVAAMNALLNNGANPLSMTEDGGNAIHVAVEADARATLTALLQRGDVDASLPDERRCTPLHLAVDFSNRQMVYTLILAGVHLSVEDNFGRTPLHIAVLRGRVYIVKLLLYYGAEPDAYDSFGATPLAMAVLTNPFPDIARALLSAGARVDVFSTSGIHILSEAVLSCTTEKNLDAIRVLVSSGASVNRREGVSGQTPLHFAALCDNAPAAHVLVRAGADLNLLNSSGQTPMETALLHRAQGVVEVLRTYVEEKAEEEEAGEQEAAAAEQTAKRPASGGGGGGGGEVLAEMRAASHRRASARSEPGSPLRQASPPRVRPRSRSYGNTAMTVNITSPASTRSNSSTSSSTSESSDSNSQK